MATNSTPYLRRRSFEHCLFIFAAAVAVLSFMLSSGRGKIFETNIGNGTIGKYTTAGATVNGSLITSLNSPQHIAVSGTDLYVTNIALGDNAGFSLTTGDHNIDIGNKGIAGEANTIRIGKIGTQTATFVAGIYGATVAGGVKVVVDSNGHLGTAPSSERFKDEIKPMDKASEAILALKPVTFRYKHELDPERIPQFGLVAEQVAKVNRDLAARDAEGKVYTVRYEAVNAMLLNEFLKEHRKVQEQARKQQEQEATISAVKSTVTHQAAIIAQQQKEIKALRAAVQKVSDQLEVSKPAPQMVADNQ
jgi:hypothetical protein